MKPHILHVFPNFKIGGSQIRFAMLSEKLSVQFSHTIMAMDGNNAAARILPAGADVVFAHRPERPRFLPARLRAYRASLREIKPDLLATYNWGAIEWAFANTGIPHVHVEDGFGPEEINTQFRRRVWFRRLALRRSRVVVPSLILKDIATQVWRLKADNILYIPNGIEPHPPLTAHIEGLGPTPPEKLPHIAWVGALRAEKNPIKALRAFAPLKDKAVLLMIGDGPERERAMLEARNLALGNHCRFLGSRTDVRDILQQCDIMALSSDTEQMPFAILEGMDAGLAIASVDVGDVRHMVCAENRPLIAARTEQSLHDALRTLVSDETARKAIGAANRAHLRRHYSFHNMCAAYQALFAGPLNMVSRT